MGENHRSGKLVFVARQVLIVVKARIIVLNSSAGAERTRPSEFIRILTALSDVLPNAASELPRSAYARPR